jgi:hypothetical protein
MNRCFLEEMPGSWFQYEPSVKYAEGMAILGLMSALDVPVKVPLLEKYLF